MTIKPYHARDLPDLHAINVACVPGVGAASMDELEAIIALSTCFVAITPDETPIGFITLLPPSVNAYDSPNLRWFEAYVAETKKTLIYVDRIALAPQARGQRLGEKLYETAFRQFADCDEIGCEVNIAPPNPGSHRFHQRLGFLQIGEQVFEPGEKAVAYYSKPLHPLTRSS